MGQVADETGIIEVVARNVRSARKGAGLSQEELAARAEIDRTYVSQVERRQRNITVVVLARLANALQIEPHELLMRSKPSGP